MSILPIGHSVDKREIRDSKNIEYMLYSLTSCDYLKLEPTNHVAFSKDIAGRQVVEVMEQYCDDAGETKFDSLYKLRIATLTLRQLLVLRSLYRCKTQADMIDIIQR
jgi:hypothetical protein